MLLSKSTVVRKPFTNSPFLFRNYQSTTWKEKLQVGLKFLKGSLSPDMRDIDEKKLYSYNINKAWIFMSVVSIFRLRSIIGTRQWQIDLEEADKLAEEGTDKFNVESYL